MIILAGFVNANKGSLGILIKYLLPADGEMYMNYMDYVDDTCMNMFTAGQADRMSATLNGLRSGLLTSKGCELLNSIKDNYLETFISIFPNPNNGSFSIQTEMIETKNISVSVLDILGSAVKNIGNLSYKTQSFDFADLSSGVYYLKINSENKTATKKIFITK